MDTSSSAGAGAGAWDRLSLVFLDSGGSSDPLRLIGAAILGSASTWAFNRVVRKHGPPGGGDRRVLAELRHIREQIQLVQGDLHGLSARVAALERD